MLILEPFATHPMLFVACSVVLGLLIGSFLNVVIYRVPVMMEMSLRAECAALNETPGTDDAPDAPKAQNTLFSAEAAGNARTAPETFNLATPGSRCPACKAPITPLQNIPVISWLVLGRRCASCRMPISARYPSVELATGVLTGFVAWHFGFGGTALAAMVFTWFLIALTMIDFDTQFLPDQLTYPLLWLGLLVSLGHPTWAEGAAPVMPRDSVIGAAAGYLSLWSVFWGFKLLTGKEGMGYGDFKLYAALGAWMGWQMLLPIILFASAVGALFGVVLMIRQRMGKDTPMAFGPFLAIAGWLALIHGHEVVSQYFDLFALEH